MTREAFIRKWLSNKDFQYCEDGRAQMREDLDKVIDYAQQKLNIASVSGKRQEIEDILWDYKNECYDKDVVVDKILAACASGAVDKTVSDGFWCVEHDRFGNNKCKRQCELCETERA